MNIVFDLGGVVFHWSPDEIIADLFGSKEIRDHVKKQVFEHPDWIALDRGTLERSAAIENAVFRTGLPRSDIIRLMDHVPETLIPKPKTLELIRLVKKSGNRIFILSNMQVPAIHYLREKYHFWALFDGIVVSCEIHMVKPESGIYQYLLQKYNLSPEETVFIDDMMVNLKPAEELGIHCIQFKNPVQCKEELKSRGCV